MSISKPVAIVHTPPACPVCGKPSYSRGGVHPQCAVARADKARKPKPPAKAKAAAFGQWKKKCPHCGRQVPARRYSCECGHKFEQTTGR
jgi:hypothetical protein